VIDKYLTKNKWLLLPDTEAITFKSRQTESTFASYAVPVARLDPPRKVVEDDLRQQYGTWVLAQEHLDLVSAPNPKAYDAVTQADGTEWIVEETERTLFKDFWLLTCRKSITATA